VGDLNAYQNYHPSDSHKTINQEEELQEEDSPEEEDTPEEGEYRREDHQEVDGDHHHCLCHKPNKESW